jgi:peptidoglycan/LPS O-acetylase OafA/YrhL
MDDPRGLPHIPALDGLRAIAVGSVIAYHLGVRWGRGGYLGVDLFFVLSGYLITSLLVDEHRRTRAIALGAFWGRRARRLLPAIALLLITLAAYAALGGYGVDGKSLRSDGVATALYVANWHHIYAHHSYFEQFRAASPLSHTWSLAVEEQFYLLWPPILLAAFAAGKGGGRRRSIVVAAALASASIALMALHFHPGIDPTRVYEGTDTRAFEPLMGAVLALVLAGRREASPRRRAYQPIGTLLGTAAFGVFLFWVATAGGPPDWMFRGGMVAVAAVVAAVIAVLTGPRPGMLGRVLSLPPVRYIGRISYGLYLWHWPVFVATAAIGLSGVALALNRVVMTLVLAVLSFHLVEQPIRRGRLAPRRAGAAIAGAAVVSVTTLSLVPLVMPAGATEASGSPRPLSPPTLVAPLAAGATMPASSVSPNVTSALPLPPTSVLVVGDSTALSLFPALEARAAASNLDVHDGAGLGCTIVGNFTADNVYGPRRHVLPLPGCNWEAKWPPLIDRYQPRLVLLLFGPWDTADHLVDGQWLAVGTPAWRSYYLTRLSQMVDLLRTDGATVVIATDPQYHHDPTAEEPNPRFSDPTRVAALNEVLRTMATSRPGIALLDLADSVTLGDLGDGVHFSDPGALRVAASVDPELAGLGAVRRAGS